MQEPDKMQIAEARVDIAEAEVAYLVTQLKMAGGTLYDICEATNTEWLDDTAFPVDTIRRKWRALEAEVKRLKEAIRDIREGFEPEWLGDGLGERWCAFCNMLEPDGHLGDCFWTVIKKVDDRIHCPDCGALIPPDRSCWYCENDPRGDGDNDEAPKGKMKGRWLQEDDLCCDEDDVVALNLAGSGAEEALVDGDATSV